MEALEPFLKACREDTETTLRGLLTSAQKDNAHIAGLPGFHKALAHAVLQGGKRVRPCLVFLCAHACAHDLTEAQTSDARHAAAAIELLHAYTLVHDDLPAMDNDVERRGQPTVWKQFGEANAILAGDVLQALAFGALAHSGSRGAMTQTLAKGATDVVLGQVADIEAAANPNAVDTAHLLFVYANKTGALFRTACELGAIAAGASDDVVRALGAFGMSLGLAFQYVDDVLDHDGTDGDAMAQARADEATRQAHGRLDALPASIDTTLLHAFADNLLRRTV